MLFQTTRNLQIFSYLLQNKKLNRLFDFASERTEPGEAEVCGEPFGATGLIMVPLYHESDLQATLVGPALISFAYTTVLIPKGFSATMVKDGICALRAKGGEEQR